MKQSLASCKQLTWLLVALPMTASALTADLNDGTLTIQGNNKNDWLTLNGDGSGSIQVKVGKKPKLQGNYSNVNNIAIVAKGGTNRISLKEVDVPGSVMVKAGSGNDTLQISGALTIGGDLEVDLNGGNNTVTTNAQTTIQVAGNASFDGNKGSDKLTIKSISTAGHLMLNTAGGNDNIQLGTKNKYVVNVGGALTVLGGKGRNTVGLYGAEVTSTVSLRTGSDADKYTILNNKADIFFDVKAGGSNDRIVSRDNSITGEYHIHCGSGKDKLVTRRDTATTVLRQRCIN